MQRFIAPSAKAAIAPSPPEIQLFSVKTKKAGTSPALLESGACSLFDLGFLEVDMLAHHRVIFAK